MNKEIKEKIDDIKIDLGIKDKELVIIDMQDSDDERVKTLSLKSGAWSGAEPWFIVSGDNAHAAFSINSLRALINSYRDIQKECFELKLEKSIWQSIPVDFGDVWTVAMDEVKRHEPATIATINSIDTDKLVRSIKKEHPNLFLDMNDMIKEQR